MSDLIRYAPLSFRMPFNCSFLIYNLKKSLRMRNYANDISHFIFLFNRFIPTGAVTQTLQKLLVVVGPQKAKVLEHTVTILLLSCHACLALIYFLCFLFLVSSEHLLSRFSRSLSIHACFTSVLLWFLFALICIYILSHYLYQLLNVSYCIVIIVS